jgi:flagellar biosynthesis protein FliQ
MNFGPKIGPLVAELLSGLVALFVIYIDYYGLTLCGVQRLSTVPIILLLLGAWILGTLVDALRNILEELLLDHLQPLDWAFFFRGEEKLLANFEHHLWSFYILDLDMTIAIALGCFLTQVLRFLEPAAIRSDSALAWVVLLAAAIIFAFDGFLLRREIKQRLDEEQKKSQATA